jgi:hypothetical protein
MMSFNLDAARICKYREEFPLHLDYVEAMLLKSRHRLSSGTKKWGGPKGASAFGNFELLEKFGGRLEFSIISLLNNHGLPKMVTRFPRGLFIQHHTATVTWNGVARDLAPDLTAYHCRLCCGDRWAV